MGSGRTSVILELLVYTHTHTHTHTHTFAWYAVMYNIQALAGIFWVCVSVCLRLSQHFHGVLSSWRQEGRSYSTKQPGNQHPMKALNLGIHMVPFFCMCNFFSPDMSFSHLLLSLFPSMLLLSSSAPITVPALTFFVHFCPTFYTSDFSVLSSLASCHSLLTSSFPLSLLICLHPLHPSQ